MVEIGFSLGVVARRGAGWRVRLQAQVREDFVDAMRLLNRRDDLRQLLLRCSTSGIPAVVRHAACAAGGTEAPTLATEAH